MILVLLVGLPCSDKDKWARKQRYPIVSIDAIKYSIHAHLPAGEDLVQVIAHTMVKALFNAGHRKVLIDDYNIYKDCRDYWLRKFEHYQIEFKEFDTSKEVCIERAKKAGRENLIPIIERMAENREPVVI